MWKPAVMRNFELRVIIVCIAVKWKGGKIGCLNWHSQRQHWADMHGTGLMCWLIIGVEPFWYWPDVLIDRRHQADMALAWCIDWQWAPRRYGTSLMCSLTIGTEPIWCVDGQNRHRANLVITNLIGDLVHSRPARSRGFCFVTRFYINFLTFPCSVDFAVWFGDSQLMAICIASTAKNDVHLQIMFSITVTRQYCNRIGYV